MYQRQVYNWPYLIRQKYIWLHVAMAQNLWEHIQHIFQPVDVLGLLPRTITTCRRADSSAINNWRGVWPQIAYKQYPMQTFKDIICFHNSITVLPWRPLPPPPYCFVNIDDSLTCGLLGFHIDIYSADVRYAIWSTSRKCSWILLIITFGCLTMRCQMAYDRMKWLPYD